MTTKQPRTSWRTRSMALLAGTAVVAGMLAPTTPAAAYVPNPTYLVAQSIGAPAMWNAGFTGKGVDIAVIDTGVMPVTGLNGTISDGTPKLYHGPDLSFDSQNPKLRNLDGYGHGTHMAGLAAGKDPGWTPATAATTWSGIAPDSKILSVKVGDQGGAVDVTQMLAAIHWVIQNRRANGLNIRVISLSYGTDPQTAVSDEQLFYATEVAWKNGIVVVASGGNNGFTRNLGAPGQAPSVISVGAIDTAGTLQRSDDVQTAFSQFGSAANQRPYVNAPGTSVVGLAVPGSLLDLTYPGARDGARYFRGSGTSQAAAIVAGAAALLVQQRPAAHPGHIRELLINSCPACIPGTFYESQPVGQMIDLAAAKDRPTPTRTQSKFWTSVGTSPVDLSRGTQRVGFNGVSLDGEKDIFGATWNTAAIAKAARTFTAWNGGTFNGRVWAGTTWNGTTFASATWTGTNFAGTQWSAVARTDNYWDGTGWKGTGWKGGTWHGTGWKGDVWAGAGWG